MPRRWRDGLLPNSIGSLKLHLGTHLRRFSEIELYNLATSKHESATVRSLAARLYVAEKELAVAQYEAHSNQSAVIYTANIPQSRNDD